jgi:nucleoside diphosphate kinase
MTNRALVFIKPHAVTPKAIDFIENFLSNRSIELTQRVKKNAYQIRSEGLVDQHYAAIARTAVFSSPHEYTIGTEAKKRFAESFGISWDQAVNQQLVCNSVEAQKKLGDIPGVELNEIWKNSHQVKMGPGLYAGYIESLGEYCVNGFYPGQREVFTTNGAEVILYEACFEPEAVSWKEFRWSVIGATDPAQAAEGSLRREILNRYAELGLRSRPEMSRNGVHAGAGPVEGFRERMVWLGKTLEDDPFALACLENGMPEDEFMALLENPVLTLNGNTGPVFDLTEDMDADDAVEALIRQR